jgi:hypothetical protein
LIQRSPRSTHGAASASRELSKLYCQIGSDILQRQQSHEWGVGAFDQLARDLKAAFPDMWVFSPGNLKYMRALAQAWPDPEFVEQPAGAATTRYANAQLCGSMIEKLP